jgi:cellulose synthase/poly-beta-1,6-N-acetylglucosamine synthase-like glycosyltransferase
MNNALSSLVVVLYMVPMAVLMLYGLNCYVMLALYLRRRRPAQAARRELLQRTGDLFQRPDVPIVTTQIAIYNEVNVAERCIRAVCAMHYPRNRHEIQVLDDSTDDTCAIVDRVSAELRAQGCDIKVLRRAKRTGFKGGALAEGVAQARGELLAVFDADFVPPADYLLSTVPFFLADARLGFAQGRWGHLNRRHSMLTRAQSVGIDGHFIVEQIARGWNSLFMNFNGTAGIWRKTAIADGGGWQWDTLTEDLDLSYRVQFAGWKPMYIPDLVVPAELPETLAAFRSQQFRWAKGSFETLIKLFPELMRQKCSWFKKAQAVFHITGYAVHPMMLALSLLSLPLLAVSQHWNWLPVWFRMATALPLALSIMGPSLLYIASQFEIKRWRAWRVALTIPLMMVIGVGFALSNTRAIAQAIKGKRTEFVRTPKRGDLEVKRYRAAFPYVALAELALGAYSLLTVSHYVQHGWRMSVPFLVIYAAGYLFMGMLSLYQALVPERD